MTGVTQATFMNQRSFTKLPGAPTIGTATAGNNLCATVTFTAPTCVGIPPLTGYRVKSTPGCITSTGASSPITVTGLTGGTSYTFKAAATNTVGYGPCSAASNSITAQVVGQQAYTTAGCYTWVAPTGVTSVSVVVVGGGGSSIAAYCYGCYAVVSPSSKGGTSKILCVQATGGGTTGGTYSGTGVSGGTGGAGSAVSGGGAAGYSGNGGYGAGAGGVSGAGSGGGASGGAGKGGGGVGILGQGPSGAAVCYPGNGLGGSGGCNSGPPGFPPATGYCGGKYGGGSNIGISDSVSKQGSGGGLGYKNNISVTGGSSYPLSVGKGGSQPCANTGAVGAVRIIWPGNTRSFPSTCTGNK